MRFPYFLFLLSASTVATASTPSSKSYGAWRVISLSSIDGVNDGDAVVILTQGDDSNVLEIRWSEDSISVNTSMYIEQCNGEESFEASERVTSNEWLDMSLEDVRIRLRTKFRLWMGQAKRACGLRTPFKMEGLDAAVNDFTDRLRFFR